jgi:hypothetical protein
MKPTQGSNPLWASPDAFAAQYCVKCKAGWTRAAKNGALTVCLLDREPILRGMTDCDRYEPKEQKRLPLPLPQTQT